VPTTSNCKNDFETIRCKGVADDGSPELVAGVLFTPTAEITRFALASLVFLFSEGLATSVSTGLDVDSFANGQIDAGRSTAVREIRKVTEALDTKLFNVGTSTTSIVASGR
jgi:hypothetical protein